VQASVVPRSARAADWPQPAQVSGTMHSRTQLNSILYISTHLYYPKGITAGSKLSNSWINMFKQSVHRLFLVRQRGVCQIHLPSRRVRGLPVPGVVSTLGCWRPGAAAPCHPCQQPSRWWSPGRCAPLAASVRALHCHPCAMQVCLILSRMHPLHRFAGC
jgi:hypothetical protein